MTGHIIVVDDFKKFNLLNGLYMDMAKNSKGTKNIHSEKMSFTFTPPPEFPSTKAATRKLFLVSYISFQRQPMPIPA